jgi:radical SAM superfamily enzyme YgiQ (UPF0313 family)
MAAITLVNLNLLYLRYEEDVDSEPHVPLGCLYLTRALEDAGIRVDFRDYQFCGVEDPFALDAFVEFLADPAPIVGLSCMANLLPFTILAARALKERYPDRTILLGGVGPAGCEEALLERFPWITAICRGEGEQTGPQLVRALIEGATLQGIAGVSYREGDRVVRNPDRDRISDIDGIPLPAYDRIDLSRFPALGLMATRGCPYQCSFCSVSPVWLHQSRHRSPDSVVAEMQLLHERTGAEMFLFQDEYFISTKPRLMAFCEALEQSGLKVHWKAFGRVNLVDREMMETMLRSGCVEIRFGIESGCDRTLTKLHKGFTAAQSAEVVALGARLFSRVDTFFIWGFPDETLDDFYQTLLQMIGFRMLGARVLPSLLSLLPQTEIYQTLPPARRDALEFCPYLVPEIVLTGHERISDVEVRVAPQHQPFFQLIGAHRDIFPGFFVSELEANVLPKLELLRRHGFYVAPGDSMTRTTPARIA